tara:strand:+ start:302 stop:526 length:225 start_codon:yes stop_codon:yes gene_type:complete
MIKNLFILVLGFLVWVAYIDDSFSMEPQGSKISVTTKNTIKTINTVKNIYKITTPGIKEEIIIKIKNILDPYRG